MGFFGGDKLIIGYDLGREHAQISFAASQDGTVETLSQVAGEEKFSIPTALCKRYGANQWLYGREAQRLAGENQGVRGTGHSGRGKLRSGGAACAVFQAEPGQSEGSFHGDHLPHAGPQGD